MPNNNNSTLPDKAMESKVYIFLNKYDVHCTSHLKLFDLRSQYILSVGFNKNYIARFKNDFPHI